MIWVVDYYDDVVSDMSAFHRVDDPERLDGPRFFLLANRLAAYAGVMQARALAESEKRGELGGKKSARRAPDHVAIGDLQRSGWVERKG